MNRKIFQGLLLVLSLALNVAGIVALLHVSEIVNIGFLSFFAKMRLIYRYTIVIATITIGVMLFTAFASTRRTMARSILSISCCIYSTLLTIPLLLTFIGCILSVIGYNVPLIGSIVTEFQSIFTQTIIQYVVFGAGVLVALIFLLVPIIITTKMIRGEKYFPRKR